MNTAPSVFHDCERPSAVRSKNLAHYRLSMLAQGSSVKLNSFLNRPKYSSGVGQSSVALEK
jgi:hypothetical protein